jgi:hypothetical protein
MASLGSLASLHRYPVKSMMGEALNAAQITQRGLFGDRSYALCDMETGKVVSAKNPRPETVYLRFAWRFLTAVLQLAQARISHRFFRRS